VLKAQGIFMKRFKKLKPYGIPFIPERQRDAVFFQKYELAPKTIQLSARAIAQRQFSIYGFCEDIIRKISPLAELQ